MKYPRIELKMRDQSKPPTGANCVVLLDGEPLKSASRVVIEAAAGELVKVTIEMFAYAEVDVLGELSTQVIPLKIPNAEGISDESQS